MIEKFGVTPGPWENINGRIRVLGLGISLEIADFTGSSIIPISESEKNIKLCSAAPAMFEDGVHNANIARKMYECRFEPDKLDILFRQIRTQSYVEAVDRPWSEVREAE